MSNDLSTMYLDRFEATRQLSDLVNAEELARELVKSTRSDTSSRLATRKLNWGNCLRHKFDADNDGQALEDAITQLLEAKDLARDREDRPRDKILSVLSELLFARYEAFKSPSDLMDSIREATEALKLASRETLGVILCNLAAFQQAYSELSHDPADVDIAIDTAHASLPYLEHDWPRLTMCLANLANMRRERFLLRKAKDPATDCSDLDDALGCINFPTGPSNISHDDLAILHDIAGRLLTEKYQSGGQDRDENLLEQAVSHYQSAIDAVESETADAGRYTLELGRALQLKHAHAATEDSFNAAVNGYKECLRMKAANPWLRILAGHGAGLMYQDAGRWEDAYEVLNAAVALLPDLVISSVERDSQQYALSGLSGLSNLAASMALQAGKPAAEAFATLEAGRGIMANLALGGPLATVPANLNDAERKMLQRVVEIQRQIQQPLRTGWFAAGYTGPSHGEISERAMLVREYKEKAQQLKELHGYDVSEPVSEEKLKELASYGTIVAFVCSSTRSDALILTQQGVNQLALPHLTLDEPAKYLAFLTQPMACGLRKLGFENYFEVNEGMTNLLSWLWKVAVLPVLKHLNIHTTPPIPPPHVSQLPRIYWITSGALGLMPFHAAGRHNSSSTENTMSHVLSSYATNTRTLAWALENGELGLEAGCNHDHFGKALVVGMPKTPGRASFDLIPRHLDALRLFSGPENVTYKETPSSAEIVSLLPDVQIAHFVCHGVSVPSDASSSSVLLQDPSEPSKVDHLMVRTLASLPLYRPRLAFLAACQTADNAQIDVLEEGLHLVGAFQMVGFPDVIGTMWEAEESAAADVAEVFYKELGRPVAGAGGEGEAGGNVAFAWYKAAMALRARDPEDVVGWAPFVHFGR